MRPIERRKHLAWLAAIVLAATAPLGALAQAPEDARALIERLLDGAPEGDVNWEDAKAWAEKVGGELPTRMDALVLWQNRELLGGFEDRYHWTSEPYASDAQTTTKPRASAC